VVVGCVLGNFPLSFIDRTSYTQGSFPTHFAYTPETMGLQLEEPWLVDSPQTRRTRPFPIDDNGSYIKAIYKLLVDKPEYDSTRTILISNLALSPRIRKLPQHDVEMLMQSGREAARKFLLLNVEIK